MLSGGFITLILTIVLAICVWLLLSVLVATRVFSIASCQQNFMSAILDAWVFLTRLQQNFMSAILATRVFLLTLQQDGYLRCIRQIFSRAPIRPVEQTDTSPQQGVNGMYHCATGHPSEDICPYPIQNTEDPCMDDQPTGQQEGAMMRHHVGRNAILEQMLQEERSRRRNDSRNWRREREELNSVVKKLQKKNNKLLKRNKKLQEANQEAGTLKNVSKSSGQKGKGKPKIDRSVQVNPIQPPRSSEGNVTSASKDAHPKTSSHKKDKGKQGKDQERNWPSLPGPRQDTIQDKTQSHGQATSEKDIQSLPRQVVLTKTLVIVTGKQTTGKHKMAGQKNKQSTNLTGQDEVPQLLQDISKDICYAPEQEGNADNDPGTSDDADPQEVAEEPEVEPRKVDNGIPPASEKSVNMKEEPFESESSDSSESSEVMTD